MAPTPLRLPSPVVVDPAPPGARGGYDASEKLRIEAKAQTFLDAQNAATAAAELATRDVAHARALVSVDAREARAISAKASTMRSQATMRFVVSAGCAAIATICVVALVSSSRAA